MKVAILAGGLGTRLAEETEIRPKPMVEIGGRPILWHIMKHYAHFGFDDFTIALGYKGEYIKRYFTEYAHLEKDLTVSLRQGHVEWLDTGADQENWTVHLIDTGYSTMTGGRVKRLRPHLGDETFMLTYGDGVSNVDLDELVEFHRAHGKLATMTVVRPPARFGHMVLDGDVVVEFDEKPQSGEGWINGAFFVLEPGIFDYIADDDTFWERQPLENLAKDGELRAFHHSGFWQCMDTLRDKMLLESLWVNDEAAWKLWG
ncbi:MAG TPA: glucose-1-phosphate cytidylyltransferase [Acidimicrobiales bacterium]|nr:glucose-1-phosphate cytidylyltransferase [Acidimicrobiales bacterium]